jgi:CP family cyanate transporter-like MFS transporter
VRSTSPRQTRPRARQVAARLRSRRTLAAALLIAALNLRLAVAAIPPVLGQIHAQTGLDSTGAGLLTGAPVLCFGLAALATPWLIRRLRMGPALTLVLALVIAGCALRLAPTLGALFAGTVLVGCAIAVGNVLVPALIKRDFQSHRVLMTALYSVALSGGAAISGGLTVPLESLTGLGWRGATALWALPAVIALLLWAGHAREWGAAGGGEQGAPIRALWRSPLAWCVSIFMGAQSFGFYGTLSWLPTIARSHGLSATHAGLLLSLASIAGIVGALAAPWLELRLPRPATAVGLTVAACAVGYGGLLLSPGALLEVWCLLFGVGQGAQLALALGYIVARAPDSHHAAQLSTMAQSVGYLIAATGPPAMGALHSATGAWTLPIGLLLLSLVLVAGSGLIASQNRQVLA